MGHLVDNQMLWQDVRRLSPGHALICRSGAAPREIQQYALPIVPYLDLPFSAHVDRLAATFDNAVSRHVPEGRNIALLLSGGLDSRLLAGFLRTRGIRPVAVTFGDHRDIEAWCATQVARQARFPHHLLRTSFEHYAEMAERRATWEHLANGFNTMETWVNHAPLRRFPAPAVAGYVVDPILGGSHVMWAYSRENGSMSFDTFFARANAWGIYPDRLTSLLRPEVFEDIVPEVISRLRAIYAASGNLETQRAWRFDLFHRQRFHTGGVAWAYSFGAWPVFPVTDRAVLDMAAGMHPAALSERRLQIELVCQRFPDLAALPLDRNSYDMVPLRPTLRWWLLRAVQKFVGLPRIGVRQSERRYSYRVYDLNNRGWRSIRRLAERQRRRADHVFRPEVLDDLLPPPDGPVRLKDGIIDASGLKSLLGFLLWSRDHL